MSDPRTPWLNDADLPEDLATALTQLRADDATAAQVSNLHARLAPLLGWPDPSTLGMPAPDAVASGQSIGATSSASSTAATGTVAASVPPAAWGVSAIAAKLMTVPWLVVSATVATSGAFGWIGYQRVIDSSPPDAYEQPVEAPASVATAPKEPSAPLVAPIDAQRPEIVAAPITTPSASDPTTPTQPARVHAPPSLEDEARLLKHAQAELVSAPGRALQLTQEHARRFRRGVLTQEREALAIEALARLGKQDAARRRLQQFIRDYPGSPHARRVAESLTPQ